MVVIEVKGKQYVVEKSGDTVEVDYLSLAKGEKYNDAKAMLYKGDNGEVLVGKPYLENVVVSASVVDEKRDKKIEVIHYKPKTGSTTKRGFRAKKSILKIESYGTR